MSAGEDILAAIGKLETRLAAMDAKLEGVCGRA